MTPEMSNAAESLCRAAAERQVSDDLIFFLDALARYGRGPAASAYDGRAFLQQSAPLILAARLPLHDYLDSAERFARQDKTLLAKLDIGTSRGEANSANAAACVRARLADDSAAAELGLSLGSLQPKIDTLLIEALGTS